MISLLTYSAISALDDQVNLACVAGAKRGGGSGGGGRKARKRGKRKGVPYPLSLSNPPPSFPPPYSLPSRRLLRRLELMYPGCQRLFMRGFRPDEALRRTSGTQGRADVLLLLDDALKCSDSWSCT